MSKILRVFCALIIVLGFIVSTSAAFADHPPEKRNYVDSCINSCKSAYEDCVITCDRPGPAGWDEHYDSDEEEFDERIRPPEKLDDQVFLDICTPICCESKYGNDKCDIGNCTGSCSNFLQDQDNNGVQDCCDNGNCNTPTAVNCLKMQIWKSYDDPYDSDEEEFDERIRTPEKLDDSFADPDEM